MLKPFESSMFMFQKFSQLFPHSLMIRVDVIDDGRVEESRINEVEIVRTKGQVLEIVKVVFLANQQHILYSYAELALTVVSRLIGDYHALLENCFTESAYTHRTLVNTCKITYPMSCPMKIIPTFCPQMASSQNVDIGTCQSILGPFQSFQIKITHQHSSVSFLFLCCRSSKVKSSGDVGCPVEVLTSRIDQMNHVVGDCQTVIRHGSVVNDGCIWSSSTDCVKTKPFVVLLQFPQAVDLLSSIILSNCLFASPPRPELCHDYTVSQVTVLEA